MVRGVVWAVLAFVLLVAEETVVDLKLQRDCFSCHQAQKVPSEFIYRRYLTTYSSTDTVKKKLFDYLKHPSRQRSVMPPQFFGKYVVKAPILLDDEMLKERIDEYMQFYDIGKKLYVPSE